MVGSSLVRDIRRWGLPVEPPQLQSINVLSSLQDTMRVPCPLNATSHTVELWPRPGPAPKTASQLATVHCLPGYGVNMDCMREDLGPYTLYPAIDVKGKEQQYCVGNASCSSRILHRSGPNLEAKVST